MATINYRKLRRWLVIAVSMLALAFVGAAWFAAGSLIAPANRVVGPPPADYPIDTTTIPTESGSSLAAWYWPSEGATATVILLHPIRGDRRAMLERARLLNEIGYATLLIDFQAHGESPGKSITAGFRERLDVTAAVKFVRAKNPGHRIGVIGRSLGGAAALLASPLGVDALVLESVYPTIGEAVHNRVSKRLGALSYVLAPALLVQLKLRLGISPSQLCPIEHVARVNCPVLIASGDCDAHTTLPETERLFEAAREPKQLVIFEGAAHDDLLAYDRERYGEIISFLDSHLAGEVAQSEGL